MSSESDIDAYNEYGNTQLIVAASKGDFDEVKRLVEAGADVNKHNYSLGSTSGGATALHLAAQQGQLDVIEFLLDHGADINATTNMGLTPLMRAGLFYRADSVRLLIDKGAKLDVVAKGGSNILAYVGAAGAESSAQAENGRQARCVVLDAFTERGLPLISRLTTPSPSPA